MHLQALLPTLAGLPQVPVTLFAKNAMVRPGIIPQISQDVSLSMSHIPLNKARRQASRNLVLVDDSSDLLLQGRLWQLCLLCHTARRGKDTWKHWKLAWMPTVQLRQDDSHCISKFILRI